MAVPKISTTVATIKSVIFCLKGQFTVSVTNVAKVLTPQKWRICAISVVARAKGGTGSPTQTLDLLIGATSLLTAPMDLAAVGAGTRVDGALAALVPLNVPQGSEIHLDLVSSGGSSPTLDDLTVQIDYVGLD